MFLGGVALSLNGIAIVHQFELSHRKGVANTANQLFGGVPVAIMEDMEKFLHLGGVGRSLPFPCSLKFAHRLSLLCLS